MITTRCARLGLVLAAGLALAACGPPSGREEYKQDADTGAAAPATVLTPNHPTIPDSTTGVSERTGEKGVAGDRQGQAGTAAIPGTSVQAGESAAAHASAKRPPRP